MMNMTSLNKMKCKSFAELPVDLSSRLVYLSTFMSSVVIFAGYSAMLVSTLANSPVELPFSTIESFVLDGSYKLILIPNSATYDMFAVSDSKFLFLYRIICSYVASSYFTISKFQLGYLDLFITVAYNFSLEGSLRISDNEVRSIQFYLIHSYQPIRCRRRCSP